MAGLVLGSRWRLPLAAATVAAFAAGLSVPAVGVDPELALLLRFMAVVKAGMALAAAALVAWRLAGPLRPALAGGYTVAVCSMALGSGLIWQVGSVALGAALVHGGLLMFLVVGWRDRDGLGHALTARRVGRRSGRAAGRLVSHSGAVPGATPEALG